jgi:hypothetical protein
MRRRGAGSFPARRRHEADSVTVEFPQPRQGHRGALRRLLVDLALLACGISGVTSLCVLVKTQPWLRGGLFAILAWQTFWYSVRLVLMIGIWRRERAIGPGRKVWLGLTAPLPVLSGIWYGRGRFGNWLMETSGD